MTETRDVPPPMQPVNPAAVFIDIVSERHRQHEQWGDQSDLPDGTGMDGDDFLAETFRDICQTRAHTGTCTWRHVLLEEVHEALAETDRQALRRELVQVAAVAVAWVEALDRRPAGEEVPADA